MFLIKALGSLQFAIGLLVSLVVLLTVSTWLESVHGTPFAQKVFYQATWFDILLALVWVNIFCATLTRIPFQKRHVGFVITHIGILTLLIGALLARAAGAEGQMTLFEGETKDKILSEGHVMEKKTIEEGAEHDPSNRVVRATVSSDTVGLNETFDLIENDPDNPHGFFADIGPARFELKTDGAVEPHVVSVVEPARLLIRQKDSGKISVVMIKEDAQAELPVGDTSLKVTNVKYYPHAKIVNRALADSPDVRFNPAVEFEVRDDRGRVEHHTKFMLFPDFASLRGGEANDVFHLDVALEAPMPGDETAGSGGPSLSFVATPDGRWKYRIHSARSGDKEGDVVLNQPIPTGWMDITVTPKKIFNRAKITKEIAVDKNSAGRAMSFETKSGAVTIKLRQKSLDMPFSLKLLDFRKMDYPGTTNPASFESDVVLEDPAEGLKIEKTIKMNKPLDHKGWRIFQSSYIQDEALGEASVFTVAKNPGIPFIYSGALVILAGVILLFYFHPFFTALGNSHEKI